ncbi:MAG: hypothetical protein HY852_24060 [Bradyrhizobium sp.]|uniref:hypothetical protein n=1 Tax=Bradyrhizobium sp. TaxID=376 RepID=UPI0025BFE287|nr:hypothetical protein [Bradyrhizobium sp.]MBI5264882.1 hypothetical protein [Bradyrhizobium sp.]
MNWAWASSLDHLWRSPAFPMWLTLAAAGFFAIIALITLLRAEKSVANGALAVIALLAVGIAVASTVRDGPGGQSLTADNRPASVAPAGLPALSCIDELAGDVVLAACEKALFGSPESVAAAVSYAASQITRLTALGEVDTANKNVTPELQLLRRAIEHDRYGFVAHVLVARDNCTPADCAAFGALADRQHVVANMDAHLYESLIARYSPFWNAPGAMTSGPMASVPTATLPVSLPSGKPTNAEFPSAASTPAVSIMNPEPGTGTATGATTQRPPTAPAAAAPRPPTASVQASAPPAPKKTAPKPRAPAAAAPIQIAPDQAQPAAAANE